MSPLLGKTAPRGCWTSQISLSESPAASVSSASGRFVSQKPRRPPSPLPPASPPPVSVVDMPRAERWSGEPPPTYAEVRPCADPNDAGTAWRAERLKDLAWRAKCLRVHDTPEIQEALAAMRASTAALDEMAVAQSSPTYERPWWADGEYDERRAEAANDAGVAAFRAKRFAEAFDAHTEAIRLEPRRAAYHANRAAAALKLARHRCALEDAKRAVERDPSHVTAMLRGAKAALALDDPDEALALFDAALALDPTRAAATRSDRAAARTRREAKRAEARREADDARRGVRAPLPEAREWPSLEDAADAALSAAAALASRPDSEAAAASRAEALVLCGRAGDALKVAARMPEDSAERAYLSAEALWRLNDVDAAVKTLEAFAAERGARDASSGSAARVPLAKKIVALGARLHRHRRLLAAADEAEEEGRLHDAVRAIDAVLKMPHLEPIAWRRGDRRRDERTEGERAPKTAAAPASASSAARAYDFAGADAYPCFALSALLRRRARATLEMIADGAFGDRASAESFRAAATADLDACLAIDPADEAARRLRADAAADAGDAFAAFADLRAAQRFAPEDEALAAEVREAARRAIAAEEDARPGGAEGKARGGRRGGRPLSAYRALGADADADAKAIRSAYRKAAAKWHPDKWTGAGEKEQAKAAVKFRRVQWAYETLGDARTRRAYDADPGRFEEPR